MSNSTSLIAVKLTENGIQVIAKRYGKYWLGNIHEGNSEVITDFMIDETAVKYNLSTQGYQLTALGRYDFDLVY
jgi:hypothetical protein